MEEIKVGDTVRVSKDAPKIYTDWEYVDWFNSESIVTAIDGDAAEIKFVDDEDEWYYIAIPTKYLVKFDADEKYKIISDWLKAWYEKYSPLHKPFVPINRLVPKDYFNKYLELQDELTSLQCECKRFADYVMNLTHNRDATAFQFDDEYLNLAAQKVLDTLVCKQSIKDIDPEEIIKELKK